jgi:hypothetical protein
MIINNRGSLQVKFGESASKCRAAGRPEAMDTSTWFPFREWIIQFRNETAGKPADEDTQ